MLYPAQLHKVLKGEVNEQRVAPMFEQPPIVLSEEFFGGLYDGAERARLSLKGDQGVVDLIVMHTRDDLNHKRNLVSDLKRLIELQGASHDSTYEPLGEDDDTPITEQANTDRNDRKKNHTIGVARAEPLSDTQAAEISFRKSRGGELGDVQRLQLERVYTARTYGEDVLQHALQASDNNPTLIQRVCERKNQAMYREICELMTPDESGAPNPVLMIKAELITAAESRATTDYIETGSHKPAMKLALLNLLKAFGFGGPHEIGNVVEHADADKQRVLDGATKAVDECLRNSGNQASARGSRRDALKGAHAILRQHWALAFTDRNGRRCRFDRDGVLKLAYTGPGDPPPRTSTSCASNRSCVPSGTSVMHHVVHTRTRPATQSSTTRKSRRWRSTSPRCE